MNSDKAYLLGLIVGGGVFGTSESTFKIKLPYCQWGSFLENPSRAGQIASDILKVVKPMFKNVFDFDISYFPSEKVWDIECHGDLAPLKTEMTSLGIRCSGEIRKNTPTLHQLISTLTDDNLKRRFVAGLADTIGSTTPSHRRFSNDVQIISFEINGFSFLFVEELCNLLYDLKCYPDQVLWNHPNLHSGQNPYYLSWKKGFKLRVTLDQYSRFGAFAFRTKAESVLDNLSLQTGTNLASPCKTNLIHVNGATCVHVDENNLSLPPIIRGGHYFHSKHFCAVLGCPHAPYDQIDKLIVDAGHYVNPFPLLAKGTLSEIRSLINADDVMKNRKYTSIEIDLSSLLSIYEASHGNRLLYGRSLETGYPISAILNAVAFLICGANGTLRGKRVLGNFVDVVKNYIISEETFSPFLIDLPEILTPLVIRSDLMAALVGPENPKVYSRLITRDPKNKYKIYARKITEEDLNG